MITNITKIENFLNWDTDDGLATGTMDYDYSDWEYYSIRVPKQLNNNEADENKKVFVSGIQLGNVKSGSDYNTWKLAGHYEELNYDIDFNGVTNNTDVSNLIEDYDTAYPALPYVIPIDTPNYLHLIMKGGRVSSVLTSDYNNLSLVLISGDSDEIISLPKIPIDMIGFDKVTEIDPDDPCARQQISAYLNGDGIPIS